VVTEANRPRIALVRGATTLFPSMPTLQPNQWNTVYLELEQYADTELTGAFWTVQVVPTSTNPSLGNFWVDSVKFGKRTISWQVRAASGNPWRELRGQVNKRWGALHFGPSERGTQIQVQAIAVDQAGWVGSYKLKRKFAELGKPLYS
jgi:hypothetical protein